MTIAASQARFDRVIADIDRTNDDDPNSIEVGGSRRPSERVYGERMTAALERFCPGASEELRIAARGQHIGRWTSKRAAYPEGRAGYLKWRADLKRYHAVRLGEIMVRCGYDTESVARVQSLVRKEQLKRDAEAQVLEDVVCLVFLEHYFADFAAKHSDEKVIDIVRKTWRKMSADGHEAAQALQLTPASAALVEAALAA